ncbi:hypothetical protein C0989_004787 [Termitomyces sp. Mn162]|nr:hypothetical protein C0989_004787 [Termitomyces sp. Mn162]
MGELFDQSAAHTLTLSTCPQANSVSSAFCTWDQPAESHTQWPPPHVNNDNQTLSYINEPENPTDEPAPYNGPSQDRPPHFDLCAPHINAPLPHQNAPVPPRQSMGPRAPQPPLPISPSCPLPTLIPNPPADTNYFGPPTLRGPPPPQWAPGPPPGNVG